MGVGSHSPTLAPRRGAGGGGVDVVFTDGACSGNPGPGGWAWVRVGGGWASGFDPDTTNQRMELTAVLRACERFAGPLHVVSDSTYVVNCWRDRWWEGWLRRGWRNSKKEPVANRDLWEQVVPHFRERSALTLEWVKGHSGEHHNELADRLAVAALQQRSGATSEDGPTEADLGPADGPSVAPHSARRGGSDTGESRTARPPLVADGTRSAARRAADPRVPPGVLVWVGGIRDVRRSRVDVAELGGRLRAVLEGLAAMHPSLTVVTGLRPGAEELGARTASGVGLPWWVVLPYPDPTSGWTRTEAARFAELCDAAEGIVTLESRAPADADGRLAALSRRDGWLRSAVDLAVLVESDDEAGRAESRRWEKALGDDVWVLGVET